MDPGFAAAPPAPFQMPGANPAFAMPQFRGGSGPLSPQGQFQSKMQDWRNAAPMPDGKGAFMNWLGSRPANPVGGQVTGMLSHLFGGGAPAQ